MRAVLQRVSRASCRVNEQITGEIAGGLVVLLGIEQDDEPEDLQWLAKKIIGIRIFPDQQGLMNKALGETGGEILLISQFTLFAQTKKGNRPSFIRAARPPGSVVQGWTS